MNNWRSKSSPGGIVGGFLTVLVLAGLGALVWLTVTAALETGEEGSAPGANLGTFGLALASCACAFLAALLGYRTWRFFQIHYFLDRNALRIELGGKKQLIPTANIQQVIPAETLLERLRQKNSSSNPASYIAPDSLSTSFSSPPDNFENGDPGKARNIARPRVKVTTLRPEENEEAPDQGLISPDLNNSEIVEGGIVGESSEIGGETGEKNPHSETAEDLKFFSFFPSEVEPEEFKEEIKPVEPEPIPGKEYVSTSGASVSLKIKTRPFTSWPGFYTNKAYLAGLGPIQLYSTQPFHKTLLVRTALKTYAISPTDPKQFMIEYTLRRNLGAIEAIEEGIIKGKLLSHPLWNDWLAKGLILAGVVVNLALFTFLLGRFGDLPPIMRLHYNKFGTVDRLEAASATLWLPFIGLLVAVGNSVLGAFLHPRERALALILYGSILIVQFMIWIATIGIIISSGSG